MPKILLKTPFTEDHVAQLKKEFPFFEFVHECTEDHDWLNVEAIYGSCLSPKELTLAPRLQWIHSPCDEIDDLPINEIEARGNIILSIGTKKSVAQTAEFVLAGILHFAKQLHLWPKAHRKSNEFFNWPLKETMWSLKDKKLLQVGMGKIGNEVTRLASLMGMTCYGVSKKQSFHPYIKKHHNLSEMHSILSYADVVVVAYPMLREKKAVIQEQELLLIKSTSILIIVDQGDSIKLESLEKLVKERQWRGVILDALNHPLAKNSSLWEAPNFIITPNIASYPIEPDDYSFSIFRKNLRTYVAGKYTEMRNLIMQVSS
jgi:phosphoglycerate dehydrogenase-like enzyme